MSAPLRTRPPPPRLRWAFVIPSGYKSDPHSFVCAPSDSSSFLGNFSSLKDFMIVSLRLTWHCAEMCLFNVSLSSLGEPLRSGARWPSSESAVFSPLSAHVSFSLHSWTCTGPRRSAVSQCGVQARSFTPGALVRPAGRGPSLTAAAPGPQPPLPAASPSSPFSSFLVLVQRLPLHLLPFCTKKKLAKSPFCSRFFLPGILFSRFGYKVLFPFCCFLPNVAFQPNQCPLCSQQRCPTLPNEPLSILAVSDNSVTATPVF